MARKTEEQATRNGNMDMLREYLERGESTMSVDERLGVLAHLRKHGTENTAEIDRILLSRIEGLHQTISSVQEEHGELRQLIENLTEPPYFPAVFVGYASTPEVEGAIVQTGSDHRVVRVGEGVSVEELRPGDEVFLSHERNCLVSKSSTPVFLTGESGDLQPQSRGSPIGASIPRRGDRGCCPNRRFGTRGLKAGDGVRFNSTAGLALEKVEASKGEEYFLEETPADSFEEIGGLEMEIEQLKRLMTLHRSPSGNDREV